MIRWRRMQGFNALWLPGTDHAGIATQVMVERELAKEGSEPPRARPRALPRADVGVEGAVQGQHLAPGEGDGGVVRLDARALHPRPDAVAGGPARVREAARRGTDLPRAPAHQLVPALPHGALRPRGGAQGHRRRNVGLRVPARGRRARSWSRPRGPETMLGDTAVAVHPDDERYRHLVGKLVRHPFVDRTFPVIADATLVDPAFGTGAVKVTPAHDPNDFATGERHGLAKINILTEDGTINDNGGPFAGLERFAARKAVLAALAEKGLRRGDKTHRHAVGHCQRCDTVVEPYLSMQWFCSMRGMADRGARRGAVGGGVARPRLLGRDVRELAREHHGLVHLPPALVGAPDPGVLLPRRAHDRFRGRRDRLRHLRQAGRAGPRRARHLVLLGALADLDDGMAGRHAGDAAPSTRPAC